jgi:FMN reductase
MTVAIVVGNPKPRSRTFEVAALVVEGLTGQRPDLAIDLVDLGAALLDWQSAEVAETIASVQAADLVVFASPTYQATYTGLLKLFLDRISGGALAGVTAVPVMLGGDWRHSLAADVLLKPVLVQLGATCPTSGLFLTDRDYRGEALDSWLATARGQVLATVSARSAG